LRGGDALDYRPPIGHPANGPQIEKIDCVQKPRAFEGHTLGQQINVGYIGEVKNGIKIVIPRRGIGITSRGEAHETS
jgi:hypothetical protein